MADELIRRAKFNTNEAEATGRCIRRTLMEKKKMSGEESLTPGTPYILFFVVVVLHRFCTSTSLCHCPWACRKRLL